MASVLSGRCLYGSECPYITEKHATRRVHCDGRRRGMATGWRPVAVRWRGALGSGSSPGQAASSAMASGVRGLRDPEVLLGQSGWGKKGENGHILDLSCGTIWWNSSQGWSMLVESNSMSRPNLGRVRPSSVQIGPQSADLGQSCWISRQGWPFPGQFGPTLPTSIVMRATLAASISASHVYRSFSIMHPSSLLDSIPISESIVADPTHFEFAARNAVGSRWANTSMA